MGTQPCVGPNVPFGCENINTIKPNERFICRHMNTDSTRWEAWGEAEGVAEIHVNMMLQQIENSADKKIKSSSITDEMKSGLESRIANITFLDPSDVSVKIDKKIHGGRLLEFTITTSETIVAPVTGLLKTLLVASTGDVYHYLNEIEKIGNGYGRNFGNLIPLESSFQNFYHNHYQFFQFHLNNGRHHQWKQLKGSSITLSPVQQLFQML